MISLILLVISAVIGAGFATGAELVAFFGDVGLDAWAIALLVGVCLFAIMSVLIFFEGKQIRGVRWFFTAVNFATFIVMAAGLRHIAGTWALILSLGFCVVIIFWGFSKMMWVNKYLMFFVLGILLWASLSNLTAPPQAVHTTPRIGRAIYMAILYAGLNCCILQRVLSQFSKQYSRKQILAACGGACLIIMLLVGLVLGAIMRNGVTADMPILALSNNFVTKFAVFLCILTSMMILLNNLIPKQENSSPAFSLPLVALLLCCVAFGFSFFGFGSILGVVYPIIGGFMILYCGWLLFRGLLHLFLHNRLVVHDSVDGLQIIRDE